MLNWLMRLFGTSPRARKIIDLEAHLDAVSGSPLHGDIEFEAYDDGYWELEIEIDHPSGPPAGPLDVKIGGEVVITLVPSNGHETEHKLVSGRDVIPLEPLAGMAVEVAGPDGQLLTGTLRADH
ncbi:MAG: hypothetical protein AAGJ29_06400 [Pseudomonadota bacterium]